MAHREGFGIQGHGAGWIKESRPYAWKGLSVRGGVGLADTMCNGGRESREVRQVANGSIPSSNGEPRGTWPSRPGEPQHEWEPPRVVANSKSERTNWGLDIRGEEQGQGRPLQSESDGSSEPPRVVGNGNGLDRSASPEGREHDAEARQTGERQAQPSLGGDSDGAARGVDYAELQESNHADCGAGAEHGWELGDAHSNGWNKLHSESGSCKEGERENGSECAPFRSSSHPALYTSCDNRTDELRLLGNGVVPATAELAFRTLWEELMS